MIAKSTDRVWLVLGANSFAGSSTVDYLINQGEVVIGVSRGAERSAMFHPVLVNPGKERYRFYQIDINHDFDALTALIDQIEPAYIIDFAGQGMVAESWGTPEQWYETNIVAKVKLHNFLQGKVWLKKYVRVSTPEVYGSQDNLTEESWSFNPSTPYAVSHAAIDMSLRAFWRQYEFPVVFARFSNFYGPGQQLYRIVPRTIIYGRLNRTLQLHGGGVAVRAFIHGRDVAQAVQRCALGGVEGDIYHFSTDSFVSIRELVEQIHRLMGINFSQATQISDDRPGKDAQYLMSDKKARQQLGWSPEVTLLEGLKQSIAWVDQHLEEIKTLPLNYIHQP